MNATTSTVSFWQQVRTNLIAQVVAIAAGGVIAFVGSVSAFGAWWLDSRFDPLAQGIIKLNAKIETIEERNREQQREIDNHEFRMNRGREDRLEFQSNTKEQIKAIGAQLESIDDSLGNVNTSITAIETLINQRLPARRTSSRELPWDSSNAE